jgi:2-dehydro-3-deoxygluconokinase
LTVHPNGDAPGPLVVTLGEVMLRLRPPGFERLFQSPVLEATFGGGEANVAVSLARLGIPARFVTALPAGPLGDAAITELRKHGVDVSRTIRRPGRLGIYFLEPGAAQRASNVVYDRDGASMALAAPDEFVWDQIFDGATWFHVSGITPALSANAAAVTTAALAAAKAHGITTSLDLNFRAKLWRYGRPAPEVMRALMGDVDVAIANEEDCQRSLGIEAASNPDGGQLDVAAYADLTERVLEAFPGLSAIAVTLRQSRGADINGWSACLRDRDGFRTGAHHEILDIVDRVGSGDAFAAGLIHAWIGGLPVAEALDFAIAAGCLKHSIPGDLNLVDLAEVERLAAGDASGRVRR